MMLGLSLGLTSTTILARGGGGSTNPPVLFSFADDFSGVADGIPLARSPGWTVLSNDTRLYPVVKSGGVIQLDGFTPAASLFSGVDVGRADGCFAQATWLGGINANGPAVAYYDRNNWVQIYIQSASRIRIRQCVGGVTSYPLDTGSNLAASVVSGDVFRLELTMVASAPKVTMYRNGVVFPQQTDYKAGTAPAYPLAVSTSLPLSGRAGMVSYLGVSGTAPNWDGFSAGMTGTTPQQRLAMGRFSRLYQRNKTSGKRAVPIGGPAAAVTAIEFRLLQNGSVVLGWDWGAQALTNVSFAGGKWYARTPEIDAGDGYAIEVRSVDDTSARCSMGPFAVGDIIVTDGQSNATGLSSAGPVAGTTAVAPAGGYAAGGARASTAGGPDAGAYQYLPDIQFAEAGSSCLTGGGQAAALLYGLRATTPPAPTMLVGLGLGSTFLADHLPSSTDLLAFGTMTLWQALVYTMAFLNDPTGTDAETVDFAGFAWAQGEEDAGRNVASPGFNATGEVAYRAGLVTLRDALLALTGRSAAELPIVVLGLNRAYSTTPNTDAVSPGWTRFRAMQWDVCDPSSSGYINGFYYGGCMLDLPLNNAITGQPHYNGSGYQEQSLRAGFAMARAKGWIPTDRRGPIPTAVTISGNDIIVTFDLQMATSLTCAASVASQFLFATDASVDASNLLANRVTPTAMTIGTPAGGQCDVTFTFATAPAAGWAMQMYGGDNPQAVQGADPNALYGVQAFDCGNGVNVLAAGAFYPMVVA